MTSFSRSRDAAADEQASLWAARLEGSILGAPDRAALDAWLAEDPSHRTLLSQYCQFSADLEEQLPALVAAGAASMPPERRRSHRATWFTVGLAAAAAIAAAVVILRPAPSVSSATSVGERKMLTLSDGTRVELSARTSLVAEISGSERRVRLIEGEAYFMVAKDKSRPFFVETPSGSVRVTGTTFDVLAQADSEFDVTVVEGTVQVRPGLPIGSHPSDPVVLHGGDRLAASPSGVARESLSDGAIQDTVAWRQGFIVENGVPLREVLKRIAYYHGRSITATEGAAGLRLSGRYSLDDLDGFCSGIEEALPVRVTRDPNGNLRVSLSQEP